MDTLTLYRACVMAEADRLYLLKKSSPYRGDKYSIRANRRRLQRNKFDKALMERFQDDKNKLAQKEARIEELVDLVVFFTEINNKYSEAMKGAISEGEKKRLQDDIANALQGKLDEMARIRELEDALREIKDTQGKVCENYELCQHISCASSYNSWAIADKALSDKEEMTKKQLFISFCGDCYHCKDNPQAHHKDEKSFCEREGKYFNHNDALFPDWCRDRKSVV